jgi:hypothetical protein
MRSCLLVLTLFWLQFGQRAAADEVPDHRRAVVIGFQPFSDAMLDDIDSLRRALERNGYQGVPVSKATTTWTLPASHPEPLRQPINTLRFQPAGQLLVVCSGLVSIQDDRLILTGHADQTLNLAALLTHLKRLDSKHWSVTVVIDACSVEPRDRLLAAIGDWVAQSPGDLSVLLGHRGVQAASDPSPLIAGICRALTHDRRADKNHDGLVTIDELEYYLRDTMQEPIDVALVPAAGGETPIALATYRDLDLDELIADFHSQLAGLLEDTDTIVAIPEFSISAGGSWRADLGFLHRYLLEQLRGRLAMQLGEDRIVSHAVLVEQLKQQDITAATLDGRLEKLAAALRPAGSVDIVRGTAEIDLTRSPPTLTVTARVVGLHPDRLASTTRLANLTARLAPEETAMSGVWNMSPKQDSFPGLNWKIGELGGPADLAPHPMSNEEFPLRVYLTVNGSPVPTRFSDGRRLYASVEPGQDYEIMIENNSGQDLFLRLLVDGRNTLPDRPFDDTGPLLPQQYVSLTRARCWFCVAGQKKYRIGGFYTTIQAGGDSAANAVFQTFRVTDARAVSERAPDEDYREQLGVITAAFYQPVAKSASPMAARPNYATEAGDVRQGSVTIYRGDQGPGPLLGDAAINIHYGF